MSGIGAITVPSAGVVSAPEAFPLADAPTVTVAGVVRFLMQRPWRFALAPGPKMMLGFNDLCTPLNLIGSTVVRTGIVPPFEALTVTTTGVKAACRFDTDNSGVAWVVTDGDYIELVNAGGQTGYSWRIYFAPAAAGFSTSVTRTKYWQVAAGANVAATLDNLKLAINGTGIDGTNYRSPTIDPDTETVDHPKSWDEWISATTNTDTDQSFAAIAPGTAGNAFTCSFTDGGGAGTPRMELDGADTATAVFAGGTAGTGTAPAFPGGGLFVYGYGYYRTVDGAFSGISPTTEYEQLDPGETDLSQIDDPPSSQQEGIDIKVWYRSLGDGAADVLYEGYRIAVADTTDDDNLSDDPDTGIAGHALYDPSIYRDYGDGPVPHRSCVAAMRERLFIGGHTSAADYSFGAADVTNASNVVALVASGGVTPFPTKRMEGRVFRVTTSALTEATLYRIVFVVEGSAQILLDRVYEGTTTSGVTYTISDRADSLETAFSEPKLPNNWPGRNTVRGPISPVSGGIMAMLYAFESILEWTPTGLWRLTGSDPRSFRITPEYEGAGCVGSNAVDEAEGYVYWIARDGIYRWGGVGLPECISSRRVRGGDLVGVRETFKRINRTWARYSIVQYCPATRVVRFWVPLDDDVTNRYALVYDIQTGAWALDQYGFDVTSARTFADRTGTLRSVVGTLHGDFVELDVGTSDGCYATEPVGTITSSTLRTVTCSAASFPTSGNGLAGLGVVLVDTTTGAFTYNTIASNTSTTLTFTRFMDAAPTGKVIVGGIHAILESGRFHGGDPGHWKGMPNVRLIYSVDEDGQVYLSVAGDQDDPAVVDAAGLDLMGADGEAECLPLVEGRFLKIRLDAVEPGCEVRLLALRPEFAGGTLADV